MAVSATINLSLSALDTSSQDSCDAEKKCSLSSTASLPSAVVAIASGTCGTTAVNVDFSEYRGADGELVDFGVLNGLDNTLRIALAASPAASLVATASSGRSVALHSQDNSVSVSSFARYPDLTMPISVRTVVAPLETAYTASYTVMLLKEA